MFMEKPCYIIMIIYISSDGNNDGDNSNDYENISLEKLNHWIMQL